MIEEKCNKPEFIIEMHSNIKLKLEIAELVLKVLRIKYKIVTPKSHTYRLYSKSLSQVQDSLALLNENCKKCTEEKS